MSRSQEIDKIFHERTVFSDRSVQPVVETSKTHTRSFDDSESLNVELTHDKLVQPIVQTNTKMCQMVAKRVLVMKVQGSMLETKLFVIDRRNKSCGFPNSRVTTFCCEKMCREQQLENLSRKFRTTKIDMTCFSTKSTAKSNIQPVQYDVKANDSGRGQRRIV